MRIFRKQFKDVSLLHNILRILDDVDDINYGGCLIACHAIYLKLGRPKNMQIVQLSSWKEEIKHNMEYISNKKITPMSANHFVVTFDKGKTLYDSEGLYERQSRYKLLIPSCKIDQFCKNAIKYAPWNSMFDRSENIPLIEDQLKIKLNYDN